MQFDCFTEIILRYIFNITYPFKIHYFATPAHTTLPRGYSHQTEFNSRQKAAAGVNNKIFSKEQRPYSSKIAAVLEA